MRDDPDGSDETDPTGPPASVPVVLRIATWNVHLFRDRHGRGSPTEVVRARLDALDADVLVLPECYRPDAADGFGEVGASVDALVDEFVELARARPAGGGVVVGPGATGSWGIGVRTRLPLVRRDVVDLGRVPTDPVRRRAIVYGLDVPGTARGIDLVAIHLTHRVPIGALQLRRAVRALPLDRPTVLAGDGNLWGPVVGACLPGWTRSSAGATWPAHRPRFAIDHVAATAGATVLDAEVVRIEGSDHLPVVARIAVAPDGSGHDRTP